MNARQHQWVHLGLAGFWTVMLVPTVLFWANSVLWVGLISVYALIVSHLAAYAGARAEESD